MIKEIECNLLDAPCDLIAHVANCQCVMGSGVALAIKNKYPEVYEADLQTIKGDKQKLGGVDIVTLNRPDNQIGFVANIYAQLYFGRAKRQLDYEALYSGLLVLRDRIRSSSWLYYDVKTIGFPHKIGCGTAGGSWPIVSEMIVDIFGNSEINVLICKI